MVLKVGGVTENKTEAFLGGGSSFADSIFGNLEKYI
jgi:hypothetical protein